MWLEVDQHSFAVRQQGLERRPAAGGGELYASAGAPAHLGSVTGLFDAEYCQAVEVDRSRRTVSFGRDYLGHYPMLYAQARDKLFISDEVGEVGAWLARQRAPLTFSEEAIALYFAIGYVPQGMTLHNQIKTCCNASLYHWRGGQVTRQSTFRPVAVDPRYPLAELGARIEAQVAKAAARGQPVDLWCSGGLDSSIVAMLFHEHGAGRAELLTLTYDDALECAASELRFAREIAAHVDAPLRHAQLTRENFRDTFRQYASTHVGPVVDYVVPLKYALAKATREVALTGEGGDPLFSGAKTNFVLYLKSRDPGLGAGRLYAMAHKRLYHFIPGLLKRGAELSDFVDRYLDDELESYPGALLRKLLYANTFGKQGGMIFPKNYHAGKRYRVEVLHPLTSLEVYRAAFALADDRKYVYPTGKLALIELYRDRLPRAIVERRKSGTRLPLEAYLGYLLEDRASLAPLRECGLFNTQELDRMVADGPRQRAERVLLYGLLSLSAWMTAHAAGADGIASQSMAVYMNGSPFRDVPNLTL